MSSEEVVHTVAGLLADKGHTDVDVASELVDIVLQKAAARCASSYPDERVSVQLRNACRLHV